MFEKFIVESEFALSGEFKILSLNKVLTRSKKYKRFLGGKSFELVEAIGVLVVNVEEHDGVCVREFLSFEFDQQDGSLVGVEVLKDDQQDGMTGRVVGVVAVVVAVVTFVLPGTEELKDELLDGMIGLALFLGMQPEFSTGCGFLG